MTDSSVSTPKAMKASASQGQLARSSEAARRGVRITLQDVGYCVKDNRATSDTKGKPLYLLQKVNGYFEPGEMSALMGPSGSGKTTLLDVMAGRTTAGKAEGSLLFAGVQATKPYLRRFTGYVEQFDTLLGILTVREMLLYTAELKRPLTESYESKAAAVDALVEQLGLSRCKHVKIGTATARGISGGQAKRTNIGIALITDPRVLFLDEPTTGLDSFTANEIMVVAHALSRLGVTVVATIHSPTAYAFSLFDTMMQLVGGRLVYFGPQGAAALTFFQESCPQVKPFEEGYNDAEYLVDLITEADRFGRGGEFADAYAKSTLASDAITQLEKFCVQKEVLSDSVLAELKVKQSTVTPMWWALWILFKYRTTKNYKDPAFLAPRIFDKLLIALLIMTLYLGVGKDFNQNNIMNIAAILFMWSATTGFIAASYIPTLVLDRALFLRERSDGLYYVITYLCAKMSDELVINAFSSCGISAILFFGVQLQGSFLMFWISYYVATSTGVILAYFVAAISPSLDIANALLPIYAVTLMFFAGFLVRLQDIPPWWKWYSYIDYARYAFGAQMINQFENHDPIYIDGLTVLEYFGFDGVKDKWTNVGFTALFFIVFFFFTWLTLSYKNFSTR